MDVDKLPDKLKDWTSAQIEEIHNHYNNQAVENKNEYVDAFVLKIFKKYSNNNDQISYEKYIDSLQEITEMNNDNSLSDLIPHEEFLTKQVYLEGVRSLLKSKIDEVYFSEHPIQSNSDYKKPSVSEYNTVNSEDDFQSCRNSRINSVSNKDFRDSRGMSFGHGLKMDQLNGIIMETDEEDEQNAPRRFNIHSFVNSNNVSFIEGIELPEVPVFKLFPDIDDARFDIKSEVYLEDMLNKFNVEEKMLVNTKEEIMHHLERGTYSFAQFEDRLVKFLPFCNFLVINRKNKKILVEKRDPTDKLPILKLNYLQDRLEQIKNYCLFLSHPDIKIFETEEETAIILWKEDDKIRIADKLVEDPYISYLQREIYILACDNSDEVREGELSAEINGRVKRWEWQDYDKLPDYLHSNVLKEDDNLFNLEKVLEYVDYRLAGN